MIIEDFLARYEREYDYYLEVARLCQQHCEIALVQKGIKAMVTSRAKRHDRLLNKVTQRSTQKKSNGEERYRSVSDIYDDIVDLAGVRIALYFPGDFEKVDNLINQEFILKETPKKFPEQNPKTNDEEENSVAYKKRFEGYNARHYRVYLKDASAVEKRYSKSCIEIQVASVLMHAWAEVEHDLLYKPLGGKPSIEERIILDEINGLVLTGQIALERLQNAQEVRLGRDDVVFNDQYDLAIFLHNYYGGRGRNSNMIIGRADVLFRFLQLAELNCPKKLRKYTSQLDDSDENKKVLISDQLLDIILGTDQNLYSLYEKTLLEISANYSDRSYQAILGQFLSSWIDLEKAIDTILKRKNIGYKGPALPYPLGRIHIDFFSKNPENLRKLDQLLTLRNRVVHGAEVPDIETLEGATHSMIELRKKLVDSSLEEERKTK